MTTYRSYDVDTQEITETSYDPRLADAGAEQTANKGEAGGYAELDGTGKVPAAQIPATTTEQAALSSDVTLTTAGTWYDGPSLLLPAGTWLVLGHATCGATDASATQYVVRLGDGSDHYASAEETPLAQNPQHAALSCGAVVTLEEETTVKLQATASVSSRVLKAATADYGSGDNATRIVAVRMA